MSIIHNYTSVGYWTSHGASSTLELPANTGDYGYKMETGFLSQNRYKMEKVPKLENCLKFSQKKELILVAHN